MDFSGLTPIRWLAGPLDAALRPEESEVILGWQNPDALRILEKSPVNTIVVSWAAGRPEDAEQRKTLAPLIERAGKMGLTVVARVQGGPVQPVPGISAFLADSAEGSQNVFPVSRPWDVRAGGLAAIKNVLWPRVPGNWAGVNAPPQRRASGATAAGPTGAPWVDSTGWASEIAHAKAPQTPVWIEVEPPKGIGILRPEAFALAVADAEVYGSRWIMFFDAEARKAMLAGSTAQAFESAVNSLRFFVNRHEWQRWKTPATMGVLSDFRPPHERVAGELLNLLNRRHVAYRVLDQGSDWPSQLGGLRSLVYVNQKLPDKAAADALLSFARGGGTVIAPASAHALSSRLETAGGHENFAIYAAGTGRLAIASKPWTDPYGLATDAHRLMGRR